MINPPKYRAWHKHYKMMMRVSNIDWSPGGVIEGVQLFGIENELYDFHYEKELSEIILMECTSLIDADGNEVYEDDIVRSDADEGYVYEKVIRESSGLYTLENIYNGEHMTDLESSIEWVGVVGNIYDNPELLEGKHNG